MRSPRSLIRQVLIAVGAIGLILVGLPPSASATTGPTIILPASQYKVDSRVQRLYVGAYELKAVAKGARIRTSALGIEVSAGTLRGLAQFYGYDLEGNQTLWLAVLYNFHLTAKGVMIIDLLSPGGGAIIGRLSMTRSKNGDLRGKIALPLGTYAASWHKVAKRWTPTKG
jgi:hypothetical protein